jgi:hypothetical protein
MPTELASLKKWGNPITRNAKEKNPAMYQKRNALYEPLGSNSDMVMHSVVDNSLYELWDKWSLVMARFHTSTVERLELMGL